MAKSLRFLLASFILISSLVFTPVTTVHAIDIPAEINKQFTPILIDAGAVSILRVTIFNPNTFPLTNASWTDNLIGVQSGLSIATPALVNNTCGGSVTAVSGTTTISLIGGNVPAQVGATPGECYVEINVTSTTPGNLINTIPANNLTATGNDAGRPVTITNTTPASATLTVIVVTPPTLSKGFAPNTITMGAVSTLSITINNNDSNTNLTGTSFTDTLPANVVLANPVSPTLTNCGASASLAAVAGGNTIALTNATVTPNLNCVVTVNVTSNTQGVYVNTIPAGPGGPGSIVTDQGVTNTNPASATLNVQPIFITKQFNPPSFQAGGVSTLTITLQNPTASAYTGVSFSDTLPVIPNANLTYVLLSAATTCAPGIAANTATTVTLTGGTIPANSSCTVTVNVTIPAGATAATYTNIIPPGAITIISNPGVTNVVETTGDVSVYPLGEGMTGVKSFSIDPIVAGQNTRLRIDLFAPADTNLTNVSMTDNLPAGVTISNVNNLGAPTAPAITGCGATPPRVLDATTGNAFISLTGGAILASARCRIDVWVTSTTPGTVTNIISPADISNNENRDPSDNITDTLTVNGVENLSVTKTFTPPIVSPGGLSVLTITLQNTYPSPLINVSLTDPLPGTVTDGVVVAPVPNASTTCTGGSVIAAPGSQTISMTGGTIPAQAGGVPGICTITVTVRGNDSNATPSNRTNTIPANLVSGTVQSTGLTTNPIADAVAILRTEVLSIGVVKGFDPVLVYGGAASTMSIQLVNPSTAELTGIAFIDNMPLGMIIANPANFNTGTCGGTITGAPGDASFTYSGGAMPANSNCTLTLRAIMYVNGNLTNTIPAGAVTTFNGANSTQATSASLTNLPGATITKAFGPKIILVGAYSALTITVQNTSITPLVNMGLTDNLPAGLSITGLPSAPNSVNNCGGTLTAVAGTQIIRLAGGGLAASASCTIVVSVTSNTPGSYINIIPEGSLTNDQGATNRDPATDTLVVTDSSNGLTKIISKTNQAYTDGSDVAIGEIVTYQVGVVIPPGVYSGATLVDTMERGLAFVGCDTIDAAGLTTSVAGGFASVCSNPIVLPHISTDPEDIDRRVTFDFGTITNATQSDVAIIVTYRVMVLNLPANLDGVILNNSVVWTSSAGTIGPVQTTVKIVEPDLKIEKTADVNFIANGSGVTFTLVISHTSKSHTDAFDVVVSDPLPASLDYVANSLDCNDGEQDPDAGSCIYDPVNRTISAKWSAFTLLPSGDRGIIRFKVVGNASIPANGNVTNVSNVEWSSIPGDQTIPDSYSDPENPFAAERFFDPTASTVFYHDDASLILTPLGDGGGDGDGDDEDDGTTSGGGGFLIPVTGFAPDTLTELNAALRPTYSPTNLSIEIPTIKVKTSIVGVQLKNRNWDVSWLQNQIGWLNGTAYPTWTGNSVLTAHVVNAVGQAGVFSNLRNLNTGEYIFVYNLGYRYTYKVVSNKYVQPNDITILKHEEKAYLTLITCDTYNEKTGKYLRRIAVRAVLVDVREVK